MIEEYGGNSFAAPSNYRQHVLKRIASLRTKRTSHDSHLKEIAHWVDPSMGRFLVNDVNRGQRKFKHIINTTAMKALGICTSGFFAGVMSPSRPWFKVETANPSMMSRPGVSEWAFQVELILRAVFKESNLYDAAPVMIRELALFGTAAISHLDDFDTLARFKVHTIGSYGFALNDKEEADQFYLEEARTVHQLVQQFGYDKLSPTIQSAYDSKNYDQLVTIYQFIEPNPDYDEKNPRSKYKKFRSTWVEAGKDSNDKVLKQSGFDEFPVYILRWSVTGNETYASNAPGMEALGPTKALQIEEKEKAVGIAKMNSPMLKGPASLRNVDIENRPGYGVFYDEEGSRTEGLRPVYQVQPPVQEFRQDIREIEQQINRAFFVDLFFTISSMQGVQPRNELEIAQRNEESLMQLGPVFERVQRDFLTKLVERTFNQALEADILPPPPPEIENSALDIRFISTIAQAQKFVDATNIERAIRFTQEAMQSHPEAGDNLDIDEAHRNWMNITGVIPSVIRSADDVAQLRQQRAEAMQRQQQAQEQQQAASANAQNAAAARQLSEIEQ